MLFALVCGATRSPAVCANVFQIHIVDSQTARGVPLVEMTPLGGAVMVTDSNGFIALDDPSLLNRNLQLGLQSYGYANALLPYGSRPRSLVRSP
jgi:hypothetical protein